MARATSRQTLLSKSRGRSTPRPFSETIAVGSDCSSVATACVKQNSWEDPHSLLLQVWAASSGS